jgi:uncharacterized protein (TIGR02466 family)
MNQNNYLIENWFSTPIYSGNSIQFVQQLYQPILNHLNSEKINKERFFKGRTTYNTNENLALEPAFEEFVKHIKEIANIFLTHLGYDYEKISKKFNPYIFATELNKGSFQERHIHAYQLSGILYIKVPDGSAPIVFNDPIQTREYINWPVKDLNNSNTFLTVNYKPVVGTLLMWPSWLYHEVLVHNIDDNRIGLVFNL